MKASMKKLMKWGGIALVALIIIAAISGGKSETGSSAKNAFEAGMKAGQESATEKEYKEVARVDAGVVENISVLITPGETNAQAIAEEVKKTCKKQCNINIYDDKKAFELQEQYDKMMVSHAGPTELEAWKKANYVYVADHFIGYMEFSSGTYNDYPYKDILYKELTGQK